MDIGLWTLLLTDLFDRLVHGAVELFLEMLLCTFLSVPMSHERRLYSGDGRTHLALP